MGPRGSDPPHGPHGVERGSTNQPLTSFQIDTVRRFVLVKFTKRLTFSEIENYASALRADPQFVPSFSEIVDLRRVEEVALSSKELMKLADKVDPFDPTSKRAFLVQSQDQINAAQIHRMLRPESETIRIFFSLEKAEQWVAGESDLSRLDSQ